MAKKVSCRKKGTQRGIPRHQIGSKEGESQSKDSAFLCFSRSKYLSFGKKCFEITFDCCERFHLIGFTRTRNGDYVPLSRRAQIWHYATIVFCLALCLQKTWAMLQVLMYERLRMESFMCLTLVLVYDGAVLLSLGNVMMPKETMDLLNSWSHIATSLPIVDPSSNFHPLNSNSACIKTLLGSLAGQGVALGGAILSIVMGELPILMFTQAETFGLLPGGILPNWAWQVMFAPLEWFLLQPFMLVATFSANFLYMASGALDIYLQQLRRLKVQSTRSRRRVEQMYVRLELFNRIAQVWIRFYFPPWLLSLSLGVIITTFVTIRYTELPLIFYVAFPYVGFTLLLLIFWQSYDMLQVIRASEGILGGLCQHHVPYFQGLTRSQRVELMKRARAMRPLVFSLADSEFSLSLPINTWDEILNQIVFLLSL